MLYTRSIPIPKILAPLVVVSRSPTWTRWKLCSWLIDSTKSIDRSGIGDRIGYTFKGSGPPQISTLRLSTPASGDGYWDVDGVRFVRCAPSSRLFFSSVAQPSCTCSSGGAQPVADKAALDSIVVAHIRLVFSCWASAAVQS
jgi:hypothetical protein